MCGRVVCCSHKGEMLSERGSKFNPELWRPQKNGRFLFLMATAAIRLRILLKNKKSSREEESGSDFFLLFVQKIYKFWG